jgi:hypothetical protein
MASFVQLFSTASNFTLANGETGYVGRGATVNGSVEGTATAGTSVLTNYGDIVFGGETVRPSGSGNFSVFNHGGISTTSVGGFALGGSGSGVYKIYNDGVVQGNVGSNNPIQFDITNSGKIIGNVIDFDFSGNSVFTMINSGEITGNIQAANNNIGADSILNVGAVFGSVSMRVGNDTLLNFGHIYGNIDMGAGSDTVYTHLSDLSGYMLSGGADSDTLVNLDISGVAAINLDAMGFENYAGKEAADYVWAGSATASLSFNGGAGNDAFVGGASSDYVAGGLGADYLDGGAGFNTVVYSGSITGVNVNLFSNTVSGGDATGDTILNFQAIVGSDNSDNLYGNNGVNYISGAGGNDVIAGFGGNDNLTGGAGNDIFYYGSAGFGNDEITDFSIGQDQAYISTSLAANFGALTMTLPP